MAIAKVVLNGVTQMDVTQKTVTAATMLSGETALKNDGTGIVGNIPTKSAADLSASGSTVTVASGYYSSATSKNVAGGAVTAPGTITATSAAFTVGTGTITLSKTVPVTPTVTTAGYISSGTQGNADVALTAAITTKAASTYTPSTAAQTIASNQFLTGVQTIDAIPSAYIIPSGTVTLSSSGTFNVSSYASANVTVTGGPSYLYEYTTALNDNFLRASLNGTTTIPNGFCAYQQLEAFPELSTVTTINSSAFIGTSFRLNSSGGFSEYFDASTNKYVFNFESAKSVRNNAFNETYFVDSVMPAKTVVLSFPALSSMALSRTFAIGNGTAAGYVCGVELNLPALSCITAGFGTFMPGSVAYPDLYSVLSVGIGTFWDNSRFPSVGTVSKISLPSVRYCINNTYIFGAMRELSEIDLPECSYISYCSGMFYSCSVLESVSFPKLNAIYSTALMFCGTKLLKTVSFPSLTTWTGNEMNLFGNVYAAINIITGNNYDTVRTNASKSTWSLGDYYVSTACGVESVYFPVLSSLSSKNYAFNRCLYLSTVSFPSLEYLDTAVCMFQDCRTLSIISFPVLSTLNKTNYMFSRCYSLESAYFPELKSIVSADGMFKSCFSLSSVVFDKLESISSAYDMFYECSGLSEISFPKLQSIGTATDMFARCANLETAQFPSLQYISNAYSMFWSAIKLRNISMDNLVTIGSASYMFGTGPAVLSAFEEINLPKLSSISNAQSMFAACQNMKRAAFNNLSLIGNVSGMFGTCYSLSSVYFGSLTSMVKATSVFGSCRNIISLFMLASAICPLDSTVYNAMNNSPLSMTSSYAYRWASIYVPSSLVDTYKTATNWTTISSKFFAYEDYFGAIGSLGYIAPSWTPICSMTINSGSYTANGNGWKYIHGSFSTGNANHYTVVFDGTTYPLARYNATSDAVGIFGAPTSGATPSYKWDYYPFHLEEDYIVTETSDAHTLVVYNQLP